MPIYYKINSLLISVPNSPGRAGPLPIKPYGPPAPSPYSKNGKSFTIYVGRGKALYWVTKKEWTV